MPCYRNSLIVLAATMLLIASYQFPPQNPRKPAQESSDSQAVTTMSCGVDEKHAGTYSAATSFRQVKLDRDVAELKSIIEQELRQPILCLVEPGLHDGPLHDFGLASSSQRDGNLYIVIDPDYLDRTEITHELFHLKMRTEGVFVFGFDVKGPANVDPDLVFEAQGRFGNLIQHSLFFGRMRAMGIDPAANQRKTMIQTMSGPMPWNPINSVEATYDYAQCVLLFNNPSFTKQYGDWLKSVGFGEEVGKGEQIAQSIAQSNPRTEEQMKDELAKDLTIMFEEQFTHSMFTPRREILPHQDRK